MKAIAYIHTDFPTKFGLPRQSGLVDELEGAIFFEPKYRNPEGFKGLENFSHIWLLWEFSKNKREEFCATVKPPRLGGKKRMGVFATRSPFRPNPIGLSCVRLKRIDYDSEAGPVLIVSGIDLMDKTPIYDIKPYIPYTDCHIEATEGFVKETKEHALKVIFPEEKLNLLPEGKRKGIIEVLKQDPRPAYDTDCNRIYGVLYAGYDVHFCVDGENLTVCDVLVVEGNR